MSRDDLATLKYRLERLKTTLQMAHRGGVPMEWLVRDIVSTIDAWIAIMEVDDGA